MNGFLNFRRECIQPCYGAGLICDDWFTMRRLISYKRQRAKIILWARSCVMCFGMCSTRSTMSTVLIKLLLWSKCKHKTMKKEETNFVASDDFATLVPNALRRNIGLTVLLLIVLVAHSLFSHIRGPMKRVLRPEAGSRVNNEQREETRRVKRREGNERVLNSFSLPHYTGDALDCILERTARFMNLLVNNCFS